MNKLNIKMKILLPTIALVLIGFAVLTSVIMVQFERTSTDLQDKYVKEFAYHHLYEVKALIEKPLDEARSLAAVLGESLSDKSLDRKMVVKILEKWISDNDIYYGVYTGWEKNAFDGIDSQYAGKPYHDKTGRFIPNVYRDGSSLKTIALADYGTLEYYQKPKSTGKEIVTNPYIYEVDGQEVYLVSMVVPIFVDGEFVGIVGADISMEQLQGVVDDAKLFKRGYIWVMTEDNTCVAHPKRAIVGTNASQHFSAEANQDILNAVATGTVLETQNTATTTGVTSHVVVVSDEVGQTGTNWSMSASVPVEDKTAATTKGILVGIILAVSFLGLIIFILFYITGKYISKPMTTSINQIQQASVQVSDSSKHLSESSQQLSEGSTEQAASIEETSATMDETSSMVKQNAENTRQANDLSQEATDSATDGAGKMQEMITSMEELKKSSAEISKIIKVIDEIAFQTNMLALNAAVEAARAGDAGQGFAVVAAEVRNLAQKSAQAAKDTAEIIDRNIELSEKGVSISMDVNVALEEIMGKSKSVNQLVGEIAAASDEQAKGTAQVTEAIGQMEQVVQSNAAAAEETAASSEEMQAQAEELNSIVVQLSKLINGVNAKLDNVNDKKLAISKSSTAKKQMNSYVKKQLPTNKHIVSPDDVIPLDNNDDF